MWFKKNLSESLRIDDKIYYPSTSGIALIAQVKAISDKDIIVRIGEKEHYLEKTNVDDHAILVKPKVARSYVSQRIDDPENQLIYLRLTYNKTLIDKLYNWYCRLMGRPATMERISGQE